METVFFTSDPITLALIAFITIILIGLGRKLEITAFPIMVICYSLGLLIYHTVGVNSTQGELSPYYFSIAVDLVMLFLGFMSYLWVDNIVAKTKDLKSYGDPLSWFWDKF